MANNDRFIGRLIDGRVFKQVASILGRRNRSSDVLAQIPDPETSSNPQKLKRDRSFSDSGRQIHMAVSSSYTEQSKEHDPSELYAEAQFQNADDGNTHSEDNIKQPLPELDELDTERHFHSAVHKSSSLQVLYHTENMDHNNCNPHLGEDESLHSNRDKIRGENSLAPDEGQCDREDVTSHLMLSPDHYTDIEFPAVGGEIPLTSKCPDIFLYTGKHGYTESALSLTEMMVWQLNTIFQCQAKIDRYQKDLSTSDDQQRQVEGMIAVIEHRIKDATEGLELDHDKLLDNLEIRRELLPEIDALRTETQQKLGRAQREMNSTRRSIFDDLKMVMKEYNLLEPTAEDSEAGSEHGAHVEPPNEEMLAEKKPKTSTPSEILRKEHRIALERTQEQAYEAEFRVQDAKSKLETWHDHYEHRYQKYKRHVEEGKTESTITAFDNRLLMEHSEAIRELIQAEQELETIRVQLRALGPSSNMSIDYHDYPEDDYRSYNYRESMENSWIEHVDRNWIENWATQCEEDDGVPLSADVDEWEMEEVGISDSVSMIALGKERVDIDRWKAMREVVALTTTETYDLSEDSDKV